MTLRVPPTDEREVGGVAPSPAAARTVRRALARRESVYLDEVQRLLDAGLEVMEAAGDRGGPKVADVVRTAGLSNQAFYRHFASKDDLVAAVVEAGAWRLVGYLDHRMEKVEDPFDKIRAWIEGVLSQASIPSVARSTRAVMWNLRQLPAQTAGRARPAEMDRLLVGPLKAVGSADPERDAEVISAMVFGRLDGFLWVAPPTDDDVAHVIGFCLAGIRC
jgi:AcrR family transcriptional regulator